LTGVLDWIGGGKLRTFTIKVARIEKIPVSGVGGDVRLTFRFERDPIGFDLAIIMRSRDFDDTEVVQVARSQLSEIFGQLAAQSAKWTLSEDALSALAKLNRRTGE
jgi:hypothetical protein